MTSYAYSEADLSASYAQRQCAECVIAYSATSLLNISHTCFQVHETQINGCDRCFRTVVFAFGDNGVVGGISASALHRVPATKASFYRKQYFLPRQHWYVCITRSPCQYANTDIPTGHQTPGGPMFNLSKKFIHISGHDRW